MDVISKPKANIIIDASQFDLFETCAARYNYRYRLLRVPQKKASALDKGTLIHEGYGAYYNALKEGKHFNDRVQSAINTIRVFSADPAQSHLDPEETEYLVKVAQENLEYWRYEDESFTIKLVEEPFAYTIFEDEDVRILISGKIDLLVDKPGLGRGADYTNLPIDHKTYSRDGEVLELSNQFINYVNAVNSNFLVVNRIGLQTSLKPQDKYKRLILSYDPLMIQQWKDNVTKVILNHYATCVAMNEWPMNYTSCLKFNRKCEYYEVCKSSGDKAKLFKLENDYVEGEKWDVTKRMGENE